MFKMMEMVFSGIYVQKHYTEGDQNKLHVVKKYSYIQSMLTGDQKEIFLKEYTDNMDYSLNDKFF